MFQSVSSRLTEQQKKKFLEELNEIVKLAPERVQQQWAEGGVLWDGDKPHYTNDFHLKLKGKCYGRFMALQRKLDYRML